MKATVLTCTNKDTYMEAASAFPDRREPIRIAPRHMHPRIQVKTKLLPEQASCLPGKQSVRMCVRTEPRGRHGVHKARADETDDTMSEHASFHAWLCSHKREKDSSDYREPRLLH